MQLKTLKIKGFKSFADPTTIQFGAGVTAVVGPNGSGKSNVIEAIRWVMGEQSAKSLRGGRMNDVIFSGTNERKAMNQAEVTLTLDNSTGFLSIEADEVSISRRLGRDGTSDYFINKQNCRLKDVVELFMDSGLGKESFSVISQGQVESIFNSKPEDRRAIFEEAAGVFKYKVQKQEAEKKLDKAQDNLDRVEDILYELKAQAEPLEEQAKRAEIYLEKREQLIEVDTGLTVMKINRYKEELEAANEDMKQIESGLEQKRTQSEQVQQQQLALKENLKELKAQREVAHSDILEIVQAVERTESDLALLEEKTKHKEAFLNEKQASIAKAEAQQQMLREKIETVQAQKRYAQSEANQITEQLHQAKERLTYLKDGADDRIEELRYEYVDLMQEKATLNNDVKTLESSVEKVTRQVQKNKNEHQEAVKELTSTEEKLARKEAELAEIQVELDELLQEFKQLKASITQKEAKLAEQADAIEKNQRELEQVKAKRESLAQMTEHYAGYFAGVKAVMKNRRQLSGVVGTVADLIQIPEQYLTAIDTSLGSSSQFIVVEQEKDGREAINFLKRAQSGRATFLPLTTIKPRHINHNALQSAEAVAGFVGVGSDLIDYEKQVSQIIENLLGNTLIAADLKSANKIAKAVNYRYRVVSLDGNMMNAGGSMTGGGSKSNNSHIFTQKKELEDLRERQNVLEEKLADKTSGDQSLKQEHQKLNEKTEKIKEIGEQKRYKEQDVAKDVKLLQDTTDRLRKQVKVLNYEQTELLAEAEMLKKSLTETKQQQIVISEQVESVDEELTALKSAQDDSEQIQETLLAEMETLREQLSRHNEEVASTTATLKNFRQQLVSSQEEEEALKEAIQRFETGEELLSEDQLQTQLQQQLAQKEEKQAQEKDLKQAISAYEMNLDDLQTELDNLQEAVDKLVSQKNQIDVKLSRLDVNIDHQLAHLAEEYQVSYEDARLHPELELSFDQASARVKQLKQAIATLGHVNIDAIEEYQQLAERLEFLGGQQQDLLDAKAQLRQTMERMDQEVKIRFKEMFDQIKEQFSYVFPKLFKGGRAQLELTDPDNLLETGVEIIAQPPGKQLTSLSLLSGGERALTAISLLFAIIHVNPIPFCILDEAEAALDESNVFRFGKYLQSFETDTQFIVITHRKGTMEQADSLYGITMQERGVSKLVSIQLEEALDLQEDFETQS
ncbi:chromosome segregation protein SMC [Dolosigranulum pigrum]|uniref:Chromosome partition protein Smc n=1 Tax=Dolosigranulum pigrum ATCC 51524 TaxID=883103 RepID=H3NF22_9LACT|nr:chromosome segregation protein SMC [Dolosigranulum pigrum]EHR33037.1 chromosome segregation protein SMC [Dolosigranulum pigrum ATCC 51524]